MEAETCFKMPVTAYQLVRWYVTEYLDLHQSGCKAEVMWRRRICVSSEWHMCVNDIFNDIFISSVC